VGGQFFSSITYRRNTSKKNRGAWGGGNTTTSKIQIYKYTSIQVYKYLFQYKAYSLKFLGNLFCINSKDKAVRSINIILALLIYELNKM
jgi:hypothetical protein